MKLALKKGIKRRKVERIVYISFIKHFVALHLRGSPRKLVVP
jgi:hypothetical protein